MNDGQPRWNRGRLKADTNMKSCTKYANSVKDAGYFIFVGRDFLGSQVLLTETVVSASGNFTNGPASLQCMYQPSINTYSNVSNVVVSP